MNSFSKTVAPRVARALLGTSLLAGLLAGAAAPAQAQAQAGACSLVASPAGSDSAQGTDTAPLRTAQRLIDLLGAGQTGCLRAGTYNESLRFNHGGAPGAALTLTSYPGERATVVGRMYLPSGSDNVTVRGNDVTNGHTAICFVLGSATYGTATRVTIDANRIHGCGRLPATNHDHGIYIEDSSSVTISWNLIYDNADRGVQLYPNAQYSTVVHNVIDGNGSGLIFSGDYGTASSNNIVAYNVISNAVLRYDVESWYPAGNPLGVNNVVHDNCLWGGANGTVDTSSGGFTLANNTTADPQFANRAAGNFAMASTSPCAAIAGDVQAAVNAAQQSTTTTTAPATTTTTAPATTTTTAPATTTTTAPAGLVVSNVAAAPSATSAVVSWTTNAAADSRVDYGKGSLVLTTSAAGSVTAHSVVLTGLARRTTYSYRVQSTDAAGRTVFGAVLSFRTSR
jgi:parallel beta-helix repeat protein